MLHLNLASLLRNSWFRQRTHRLRVRERFIGPLFAAQVELLENRTLLSGLLATAETFAVLAGSTVTNTGPSVISGDLGVSPGTAVTGFPPGTVTNGTIHAADAVAAQAESDLTTAYNTIAGEAPTQNLTGQDLGGLTLTAGVYKFDSSAQLTGTLTLDAQGNPNAEFDFQIGSTLTTASAAKVVVINGGDPCNVFWQVGSSATVGTASVFVGHILALTSITLQTGASVEGSALARNGAVTLDTNNVSNADCLTTGTTGSISGLKFNDLNGDGIHQSTDPGLSGVTVDLLDASNNIVQSTISDLNGDYLFRNVALGTPYHVVEEVPAGATQTTPNPAPITLTTAGQTVAGGDFGDHFTDFTPITIGGTKFQDTNGNGAQDTGEPGLAGVTIVLDVNNNGVLTTVQSTTTGTDGSYSFTNVSAGTYYVLEVPPTGFIQTTTNPPAIVATSGANVGGVNFGNFQQISISGTKFLDTNGNGIRNTGELGLQGVTIFLDANNDGLLDNGEMSTTTDVNGNYTFSNVGPGTFHVLEVLPTGYVQTTANPPVISAMSGTNVTGELVGNFQQISISGTKFLDTNGNGIRNTGELGLAGVTIFLDANNDGILDNGEMSTTTDVNGNYTFSNVGPGTFHVLEVLPTGYVQTTANPPVISASSGTNVSGELIGNFQQISISGTKFLDTNGNGIRNTGELGLKGVTIFLDANNDGLLDNGETSTTTDVNGNYTFTNLGPGTYHVLEVLPTGYTQTTANPAAVVASSGTNVSGELIGNFKQISISGTKFLDINGNGIRDCGDTGLKGITIFLDANNDGILDNGEKSTTTDINGNYTFTNLGPGTYHVLEVKQPGYTQTTANPAVVVASSGINVSGELIGNFQQISICGTVYQDTNRNCSFNTGEACLKGVTVYIDANNNGVFDKGEKCTTTDANGNYSFANLGPGTYHIREVLPSGFKQTTANLAAIMASSGTNLKGLLFGDVRF